MTKILLTLVILLTIFIPTNASDLGLLRKEKIEICFIHNFKHTTSNSYLREGSPNFVGRNYDLNLWGVGIRYFPVKPVFLEVSSKSLLKDQYITNNDIEVGPDTGFSSDYSDDLRIIFFQQINLSVNYCYNFKERINLISGIGSIYGRSLVLRDGVTGSTPHFSADYFSWDLKEMVEYQLTERLKLGIGLIYETRRKIEYINKNANPPYIINLDINPLSFETTVSLNF